VHSPGHEVHRAEQESILGHFLLGGLDLEVYFIVLDRLMRATTRKRSSFGGKSAPQTKFWLSLCVRTQWPILPSRVHRQLRSFIMDFYI